MQIGSGVQDMYFRTPDDIATADASYKFPQVNAARIQVMGYGLCVNALTGTSLRVDVKIRDAGNLGAITLEGGNLVAGYTTLITGEELTGVGWRSVRATPTQRFLAEMVGGEDGFGAHSFDGNENGQIILEIQKTAVTVLSAFAWLQLRVFSRRDDAGNHGYEAAD